MTVGELIVARSTLRAAQTLGFRDAELMVAQTRMVLIQLIPQLWTAEFISDAPDRTDRHHLILLKPEGS